MKTAPALPWSATLTSQHSGWLDTVQAEDLQKLNRKISKWSLRHGDTIKVSCTDPGKED